MKLVNRTGNTTSPPDTDDSAAIARYHWKVLLVDDEEDVRTITKLNLRDFAFAGFGLHFIEANSAAEAMALLQSHPDIALMLIDVVMETDDAGLKLVQHIREELLLRLPRIIIRTGQPGVAPERYVIDNFDIDGYANKTELTVQKLYTLVRAGIKSYRDLKVIDDSRTGLKKVIEQTPRIYQLGRSSLSKFFSGILSQIVGLCYLNKSSYLTVIDGMVVTFDGERVEIKSGTGEFEDPSRYPDRIEEITRTCIAVVTQRSEAINVRDGAVILPLKISGVAVGFVYLEPTQELTDAERDLLNVFANQCSSALESLQLHLNLKNAYHQAIDMLAEVAEFKDTTTGSHINRLAIYTQRLALAMGRTAEEAELYGQAARLHDVGKVGIPDSILKKTGPLNDEEYAIIKQHTHIGAHILGRRKGMETAKDVALGHHERWDGRGYPFGISGEDISLLNRIVSLVDVFDALVSQRPYKTPWPVEQAIEHLQSESGQAFDPQVVDCFINLYQQGKINDLLEETRKEIETSTDTP